MVGHVKRALVSRTRILGAVSLVYACEISALIVVSFLYKISELFGYFLITFIDIFHCSVFFVFIIRSF